MKQANLKRPQIQTWAPWVTLPPMVYDPPTNEMLRELDLKEYLLDSYSHKAREGVNIFRKALENASRATYIDRIKEELKELNKDDRIAFLNKMLNDINIKGSTTFDNAENELNKMLADEQYYSVRRDDEHNKDLRNNEEISISFIDHAKEGVLLLYEANARDLVGK